MRLRQMNNVQVLIILKCKGLEHTEKYGLYGYVFKTDML
jgi:hypothetical protein